MELSDVEKKQAIKQLWHMGVLSWKLYPVQKDLYDSYHKCKDKTVVWNCSRRLGKSYALCCLAIETCLSKPGAIVKYVAPTQKHVAMIIYPLLRQIIEDCPKTLKPVFKREGNLYRFPNGSEIQIAGTDSGRVERLRGGNSDLCIIDEAGFCNELKYIIQSILIPTTTLTFGKILLSSTPPIDPAHDFISYMEEAEKSKNYVKKTIYDGIGSHITQQMIDAIIKELGGEQSYEFRREYLCEVIKSDQISVVPEFNDDMIKQIVKEHPRPSFFDIYVAGDIGMKDFTAFLFAYYDFKTSQIIIEDEWIMNGVQMTTDVIAEGIKTKENTLFTNPFTKEIQKPYQRVCDNNNLILINDLQALHGLTFQPTQKDEALMAINNMRILIKQKRIIINPRCTNLINHLKYATWKKDRSTFARSQDNGHYDCVAALVYLCRNVQQQKNPYPSHYQFENKADLWDYHKDEKPVLANPGALAFKDTFKVRKSLGLKRTGFFRK